MRGFWADEKVDNGQWNQQNYFYRCIYNYYKKKEKEFLLKADGIVTLTKAAKDYLLAIPVYKELTIEVIPCCADLDHFNFNRISPQEISSIRNKLGIPGTARIITYLGSVGGWYMTAEMFSFFKVLVEKYPGYVLLVLTKDDVSEVKREAVSIGIPNDNIFVGYANRQQLPGYLAMSDYGLFFIRNTFSKIASSPTKHGELMGMGIPVICNNIGDTGFIVNTTHTGFVLEKFIEPAFKDVVNTMNETSKFDKEYIRSCASIFDLDAGAGKYLNEYNRMLVKKNVIASK